MDRLDRLRASFVAQRPSTTEQRVSKKSFSMATVDDIGPGDEPIHSVS
jgi:hypothetical protein